MTDIAANTRKKFSGWKMVLAAVAVVGLLGAAHYFRAQDLLKQALSWISGLGAWGAVVFVLLYILACVLFLPGWVLTVGAGVVFGVVMGTILVSAGATLGATAAFLVGRYGARDWVAGKLEGRPEFKRIDEAVGREGWKIVLLTRLSPIFPFNLLNYAFGLTKVSLRDFVWASWLGMLPGSLLYVYIGSLAGDLATLGAGGRERTPAEWAIYGVGLLATVAVTVYVTRVARRALKERV